jgi:hypothetical protein
MNPGYLSLVLLVVSLILFASGWKDIILRGITHQSLLLFFVSMLFVMPLAGTVGSCRVFFTVPLLVLCSIRIWMRNPGWLYRIHSFSVSLLLGSVTFFLKETLHLMPSMILINKNVTTALFIGLLSAGLTRLPLYQVANVTLGLLIGESMFLYTHRVQMPLVLGGAAFQDLWWSAVFAARGCSLLLNGLLAGMKRTADTIWEFVKQRRG